MRFTRERVSAFVGVWASELVGVNRIAANGNGYSRLLLNHPNGVLTSLRGLLARSSHGLHSLNDPSDEAGTVHIVRAGQSVEGRVDLRFTSDVRVVTAFRGRWFNRPYICGF
jgi:hypothetical protein